MFSIISILIVLLIISKLAKHSARLKTFRIILINLLLIETFCYGYFLKIIKKGECFYLIGQQKILDSVIKIHLIESARVSEKSRYSLFKVDSDTGYSLGQDKFTAQFPTTNSQSARATREYDFVPGEDTLRLALFGDSFVFAQDEVTPNTWGYMLENSFRNLEVINFGVPGFGLGQSYLRYLKDGLRFNPDIVFFNYILMGSRDRFLADSVIRGRNLKGADLYRALFRVEDNVLKSRRITPLDLFDSEFRRKEIFSRLSLDEKGVFWNNPVFARVNAGLFLKTIFLPRYYSEHMRLIEDRDIPANEKILDNLLKLARRNGTSVVFFTDKDFIQLPDEIKALLRSYKNQVYYINGQRALLDRIEHLKIDRKTLLNGSMHYNPRGNQIYAEVVAGILAGRAWGEGERKFKFDQSKKGFVAAHL